MGQLDREKISNIPGGYGAIQKIVSINCASDNISMVNNASLRMSYTPMIDSSVALIKTSNIWLGIISKINSTAMTNDNKTPLTLNVGEIQVTIEFTPVYSDEVPRPEITNGQFDASVVLLVSWELILMSLSESTGGINIKLFQEDSTAILPQMP